MIKEHGGKHKKTCPQEIFFNALPNARFSFGHQYVRHFLKGLAGEKRLPEHVCALPPFIHEPPCHPVSFLYHFIQNGYSPAKILFAAEKAFDGRYDRATILRWMRVFFQRFFSQQFKRSAMPDGPKVGIISLSPRGDWRMPSDATASLWLREIDLLIQEK